MVYILLRPEWILRRDADDLVYERLRLRNSRGWQTELQPVCFLPGGVRNDHPFGAFGSLFGMLFLNKLPRLNHPLLKNLRFADVTHDKFFLVIEADDPKYEEEETLAILKKAGSKHIELVNE